MIPIISELLLSSEQFKKPAVLAMYCPFAVMPVLIVAKTFLEIRQELAVVSSSQASYSGPKRE